VFYIHARRSLVYRLYPGLPRKYLAWTGGGGGRPPPGRRTGPPSAEFRSFRSASSERSHAGMTDEEQQRAPISICTSPVLTYPS
jgi:hypothetical protein